MKVALDTNGLYVTRAGTARYIRGLLRGFEQVDTSRLDISPFAWTVENFDYQQPGRMLRTFYRELIWAKQIAPRLLKNLDIDVFHSTVPPLVEPTVPIKHVVTLHDLALLRHPERFRLWHRFAGLRQLRRVKDADRVICISKFTADEAVKLLGISAAKIEVIYNGCDFHPNESCPVEQRPSFVVPPDFFLFVGSLEPGKNLVLLKSVYQLAGERKIALPPLLIVGARWKGVNAEQNPPKDWLYLGHLPDEQLVYLYRRALALVFPSKYEGFGLPIVEAMALGCPVICSPVASLPEVAGEAALMAPLEPNEYLAAMRRVLDESHLRDDLAGKGVLQSAGFSWKRCAEQVTQLYESTIANH